MSGPQHIGAAIERAYELQSLLRVLSLALDGEQVAKTTLDQVGGRTVMDMAADMAGEIVEGLEKTLDRI